MDPYCELLKIMGENNTVERVYIAKVISTLPFAIAIDELGIDDVLYNIDIEYNVGDTVLVIASSDFGVFTVVCRVGGGKNV